MKDECNIWEKNNLSNPQCDFIPDMSLLDRTDLITNPNMLAKNPASGVILLHCKVTILVITILYQHGWGNCMVVEYRMVVCHH